MADQLFPLAETFILGFRFFGISTIQIPDAKGTAVLENVPLDRRSGAIDDTVQGSCPQGVGLKPSTTRPGR